MKEQEFKKMKRGLETSGTTLNSEVPKSESWGFWEEKRKSKKLKTYLNE